MNPWISVGLAILSSSVVTALLNHFLYVPKMKADLVKEYQSRLNQRKWELYTGFSEKLIACFSGGFSEIGGVVFPTTPKLWLIGSDDVIKAYKLFVEDVSKANVGLQTQKVQHLKKGLFFDLIKAMRIDLGYPKTDLTVEEYVGTIMKNYPIKS